MKNYTLLLDESGAFKEGGPKTKPSIVGGLLVEGKRPDERWAKQYFVSTQAYSAEYADINIDRFHGMEEHSPRMAAFTTDLLCALAENGGTIVIFENEKGRVIINSDITYLNVMADGIIALLRDLLKRTDDNFSLHIYYAQRTNVEKLERNEVYTPIKPGEYDARIRERLELLIAKLPTSEQTRIGDRLTLSRGVATKSPLLMMADAVCFALRGGISNFNLEQKKRIEALPQLSFPVLEKETWESIQDCILQNHYAEAIFLWYGGFGKDLERYRNEFHRQLVQFFSSTDEAEQDIAVAILSQYLQQLVRRGSYELAKQYIAAMESEFFPLMCENKIFLDRLNFDLHFHNLTIATHEGRSTVEQKEIETCRKELGNLPSTYETLDYYLKYKLREVEHLKNCYDFRQAAANLEKLVKTLTNMVRLIQTIDELKGFAEDMTSGTLGRVYGSMAMTRCFLGLLEPEQFSVARADYEKSIGQFSNAADCQRAYQNRAAVEYWSGQYEEALVFLSLAFGIKKTTEACTVLEAILQEVNPKTRGFGCMHYTSIMALALLAGNTIGEDMWEAWEIVAPAYETKTNAHPVYIILWRVASCLALHNEKEIAEEKYDAAVKVAMSMKDSFASVAAGLTMQLERLALLPLNANKNLEQLKTDYAAFMAADIPEAMRGFFVPWQNLVEGLTTDAIEMHKQEILQLVRKTPIL